MFCFVLYSLSGCAVPGTILFLLYTSFAWQQLLSRAFGMQVKHQLDDAPSEHVTASGGRLDHAECISGSPELWGALVPERPICNIGELCSANIHCSIPVSKPILAYPNCNCTKLTVGRQCLRPIEHSVMIPASKADL